MMGPRFTDIIKFNLIFWITFFDYYYYFYYYYYYYYWNWQLSSLMAFKSVVDRLGHAHKNMSVLILGVKI